MSAFLGQDESQSPGQLKVRAPYELILLWRSRDLTALPYPGALSDQPQYLLLCWDIIRNVQAERERLQAINRKLQADWLKQQKKTTKPQVQ